MEEYIKRTINTYNKTAKKYIENVKNLLPKKELEKFLNYVPHGHVLDIGCGSGVAARNIQEAGRNVVGIDLSNKLLDASRI